MGDEDRTGTNIRSRALEKAHETPLQLHYQARQHARIKSSHQVRARARLTLFGELGAPPPSAA